MKEIGIRKVLGGDWAQLGLLLYKEFMMLLAMASFVAAPVSYYVVVALLNTLTKYPMPISYVPFLITIFMLLRLSLVAVGGHVLKAVKTNPSDVLRME